MTTTADPTLLSEAPGSAARHASSDRDSRGRLLAADGTPLKQSLARAQRRQKLRAFGLVAPLLFFVLISFVAPIFDMLIRSVENTSTVPENMPRTVAALKAWDPAAGEVPGEDTFLALYYDMAAAVEFKTHTKLGTRLNFEVAGLSSVFRGTGRDIDDMGDVYMDQVVDLDPAWKTPDTWITLMGAPAWLSAQASWVSDRDAAEAAGGDFDTPEPSFEFRAEIPGLLPETADIFADFARLVQVEDGDSLAEERPWEAVYTGLVRDLAANPAAADAITWGPSEMIARLAEVAPDFETLAFKDAFLEADEDWGDLTVWALMHRLSGAYTDSHFLSALDRKRSPEGEVIEKPETDRLYITLLERTVWLSLTITISCLLLGYPIAWLLANLKARHANLLLILVLLPFWTSLLVRTSAWIVLLQEQGVVNDTLVATGLLSQEGRLEMMYNQTGTIIAMTHILLPFMILPLYSVMKTIPPAYVRAAKSLGATNFTAFWRVYFPNTVPGIGAGAILVFILSIGYYITPELVGGADGTFISNQIAHNISSTGNWSLAAALATLMLAVVLVLYWVYDRIVGIDNVKLG
ncbi:MAG: ABC transporter permease [Pikeienuella sp.]